MGDLFHWDVTFDFIDLVMSTIFNATQHTFMILTKRPERMKKYMELYTHFFKTIKNLWLGVSVENQKTADERIPILLQIPAAVRFVSVEPMLEYINLSSQLNGYPECTGANGRPHWFQTYPPLDWVICGCESGPNRRPCKVEWIHSLEQHCFHAHVPFFLKQMEVDGKVVKMPKLSGKVWNQLPKNNQI